MTIETIPGDLRAYREVVPGTMQHWDELSLDQVKDYLLRGQAFYAADYPQYSMDGSHPVLDLARNTPDALNNLVLAHLFDPENSSYDQLVHGDGNFRPDSEEAKRVIEAVGTLRIPLEELRLQGTDATYRFLRIRTQDGLILVGNDTVEANAVEQRFIERAGYTPAFLAALQKEPYKVQVSKVFVLTPDYVAQEVAQRVVGRAAWRYNFNINAISNASGRDVSDRLGLRGVRRVVVAAGDAPPKSAVPQAPVAASEITPGRCYDILLADPERAVAGLNAVRATGLQKILANYLTTKPQ